MATQDGARLHLNRLRHGRALDLLVSHAPPRDVNDRPDPAHRGFESLRSFWRSGAPRHIHGHVHLYDRSQPFQQRFGDTDVINVFPYRVLELEPDRPASERGRRLAMSRPFENEVRQDFERARQHGFLADLRAIFAGAPETSFPTTRCGSGCRLRARATAACRPCDSPRSSAAWTAFRISTASSSPPALHRRPLAERRPRLLPGHPSAADPALQGRRRLLRQGRQPPRQRRRERGQEYIDAEVIEGHIRAPLYATMTANELLLQAEYAEFLRRTDLDRLHPDHDIRPSALGRYDEIWAHIQGHRDWLAAIRHEPVSDQEAVADWYEYIYCPIVEVARKRGLTRPISRAHRGRRLPLGDAPPPRHRAGARSGHRPRARRERLRRDRPPADPGSPGDRRVCAVCSPFPSASSTGGGDRVTGS